MAQTRTKPAEAGTQQGNGDEAATALAPVVLEPSSPDATIYQRMTAILAELPPIGKTDWNEQQKFHFRGHDAVLNALNPLLAKHQVFVLPDVVERISEQRTTARGSIMYEVNLHVRFTFCGAAGDFVAASAWGEGTDMGDKATSKAMTMAFKAAIAQAFSVSTAEFQDSDADTPEETTGRGGRTAKPADQVEKPPEADDEAVRELTLSLLTEGKTTEQIDSVFDAAKRLNRGRLHPDWVADQFEKSQARLAANNAVDPAAKAAGDAEGAKPADESAAALADETATTGA